MPNLDTTSDAPVLGTITRRTAVAGNFSLSVPVTYPGEPAMLVQFVGSVYGGPIVMVSEYGQRFISREVTDRIGSTLSPEWVRAFFGPHA